MISSKEREAMNIALNRAIEQTNRLEDAARNGNSPSSASKGPFASSHDRVYVDSAKVNITVSLGSFNVKNGETGEHRAVRKVTARVRIPVIITADEDVKFD